MSNGGTSTVAAAFNDAQIASVKGRLKLTQEQESYWAPVESALREMSWRHAHDLETSPLNALPAMSINA